MLQLVTFLGPLVAIFDSEGSAQVPSAPVGLFIYTVSILYKETITNVEVDLDSNQGPGTSSFTPRRMLWRHGRDYPLIL